MSELAYSEKNRSLHMERAAPSLASDEIRDSGSIVRSPAESLNGMILVPSQLFG
jgi:hypothetical protein